MLLTRRMWVRGSYRGMGDGRGHFRITGGAPDETGRVQPQIPWNYQRKHFDGIVPTDVTIV